MSNGRPTTVTFDNTGDFWFWVDPVKAQDWIERHGGYIEDIPDEVEDWEPQSE